MLWITPSATRLPADPASDPPLRARNAVDCVGFFPTSHPSKRAAYSWPDCDGRRHSTERADLASRIAQCRIRLRLRRRGTSAARLCRDSAGHGRSNCASSLLESNSPDFWNPVHAGVKCDEQSRCRSKRRNCFTKNERQVGSGRSTRCRSPTYDGPASPGGRFR